MPGNRYQIILADTPESRTIHHRIRYQVYCLDKGYENGEHFESGLELDKYDEHSAHFLIRCTQSKQWIGTFRLVMGSLTHLPIHQYADLDPSLVGENDAPVAEFSRLAVLRDFQHPIEKFKSNLGDTETCVIFRVLCAGLEYSRQHGIDQSVFLCTRSLAYILKRKGVIVNRIGNGTAHKGLRYPYRLDLGNFPHKLFNNDLSRQSYSTHTGYVRHSDLLAPNLAPAVYMAA